MSDRKRILIVEDEQDLADLLRYNIEKAGFDPVVVGDGRSALRSVADRVPDMIILDLMLPELSGVEVTSRLRSNPATAAVPIIMATAKADEVDQVVGLSIGADDYITKPYSIKVLLAKIAAVLRRSGDAAQPGPDSRLALGPIEINLDRHEARVGGKLVKLTLTEFRLLAALIGARGRVMSRASLMSQAMGPGVLVTERTIDVHVTSIRRKLGDAGSLLRTVRGVGYRATLDPEPAEA